MKILKYQLMTEVDRGTKEMPNIVQTFNAVEIQCADESFDANYAIAQQEAYNGEITVEEVHDSVEEQIAELKAQLEATDYKVIKCYEAQLKRTDMPYDIDTLLDERQAIRDKINVLESEANG